MFTSQFPENFRAEQFFMMISSVASLPENALEGMEIKNIHRLMADFVCKLQNDVVCALEEFEGEGAFLRDTWTREEGGHGISCVLQGGKVFEKAGVNVSVINSPAPATMIHQMRAQRIPSLSLETKYDMSVAGISLVIHPHNPHAPTVHLNYRYFELLNDNQVVAWWFGGGSDLVHKPLILLIDSCILIH